MNDNKKKFAREKVTAEITLTHVQEFAQEVGVSLTQAELQAFLNRSGVAQDMWTHMMRAGEQFIKDNLGRERIELTSEDGQSERAVLIQ